MLPSTLAFSSIMPIAKTAILDKTCELAVHYDSSEHDISQIRFIIIEKNISFQTALHLDQLLLTREAYWLTQLFTLNPHGLNKRREFCSKNRINLQQLIKLFYIFLLGK